MRLLQWEYTYTQGSATYHATWDALATLPPDNARAIHRIPCVIPASAFDATKPWSLSGTLTYRSPSHVAEIFYDLGIARPSVDFSGNGTGTGAAVR